MSKHLSVLFMLLCCSAVLLLIWPVQVRRVVHYFAIFTKSLGQAWPDEVFFPDDPSSVLSLILIHLRWQSQCFGIVDGILQDE